MKNAPAIPDSAIARALFNLFQDGAISITQMHNMALIAGDEIDSIINAMMAPLDQPLHNKPMKVVQ